MARCTKLHFVKHGDKTPVQVPCYYVAGICIVNPIHEGGLTIFLKATYPFHHGRTYEASRKEHSTMVPNNIVAATHNL